MSVDAETVRRIAHLARIAVADDEVAHLQGELNAILAFVEQLNEVDCEGVEPMTSVTPMEMKKREDEVTDGGIADEFCATRRRAKAIISRCPRWWSRAHVLGLRRGSAVAALPARNGGASGRDSAGL